MGSSLGKYEVLVKWGLYVGILVLAYQIGNKSAQWIATISEQTGTKNPSLIVIDPGHGGMDPGKVGAKDVLEKDINLEIAKKLKYCLEQEAFQVVLTREEDVSTYEGTESGWKSKDMKARVKCINENGPCLAVSIHQNSYPDASVYGPQTFYQASSEPGERLASCIQQALWELPDSKKREAKSNQDYYLLKKTNVPAVIVECGFLSNPTECERLTKPDYQEQIAQKICAGIVRYVTQSFATKE